MNYLEILENYKKNKIYSKDDITNFVNGYVNGVIDDKLMTKFLKNIYDDGISIELTSHLTKVMINTGETINLDEIDGVKIDKHSTGGVGDKVSIILAPLISSLGFVVAKMSGRGLGFTGGTLDKLESIDGYNINLSDDEFKSILVKNKISIIGQTKELVPADKKIYALRDVTNLVDSMPLIASSIMSKKLATGSDIILLDVKCGDAAFMQDLKSAEELASWMINIGKSFGKKIGVEITSMETPLGQSIGNKIEIIEAINFLKGNKVSNDLREVIYSSCIKILLLSGLYNEEEKAKLAIDSVIESGKALEKFKLWISSQGGNLEYLFSKDFFKPKHSIEIKANDDGYFKINSAKEFGIASMKLGAGRKNKDDKLDYDAGIFLNKKTGDEVKKGDVIFTLYSSNPIKKNVIDKLNTSFLISKTKIVKKIILKKI